MPELPEVQTLVLQLHQDLASRKITDLKIFQDEVLGSRRPLFEKQARQNTVRSVHRLGKYIELRLEGDASLWFHLGMTGQLVWRDDPKPGKHDHLALSFQGLPKQLWFCDIRRFGRVFMTEGLRYPEGLQKLGPDPFKISAEEFARLLRGRTGTIKNLLLNQRIIAGLGNIYVNESLYRAGIHPAKRPGRIPLKSILHLHAMICEVLEEAIRQGGSSIDDYLHTDGTRGGFQRFHQVYGRLGQDCFECGSLIRKIELAGRSSFYCPTCQKR